VSHRILVVGGYYDQINSLVEAGHDVMALLPNGRHKEMVPRPQVKTHFTDVTSSELCLEIATREHRIRPFGAVISHYELSIPGAARIAEHLNIPGPNGTASHTIRNKAVTRDIANSCSDIEANYCSVATRHEVMDFILAHGKSVIKPSAGVGGRDIQLMQNENDVDRYLAGIDLAIESFQMEQFIDGTEFSVDGYIDAVLDSNVGQNVHRIAHQIISVTGKSQPLAPNFVETTHIQTSSMKQLINGNHWERINIILTNFYTQIGYKQGATHSEFLLTKENKLYLLEGHLRTGGFSIWEMTKHTTGIDLFLHHTQRLLGERIAINIQDTGVTAVVTGLACQPGTVHNVVFDMEPKDYLPLPVSVMPCPAFDIGDNVGLVHPSRYVRYGGHVLCRYQEAENTPVADFIAQSEHIARQFKYEF